ncbi:MAG TPA: V-type ATPase subunit [Termitinemataceae bacterium]|nr:V-type ATPase subunit [Termitinemataceae bacterium]HOM23708.1 V-type ATPase subunit [Termitinemataceae bacterium]HPQ00747.1 V-type ATPase subunit [Termitinemataceae bacterium]
MMITSEQAYTYAKASGIIGKSFMRKRMQELAAVSRLNELDRLVFGEKARELPERALLFDLQRRIMQRTAEEILNLVKQAFPRFLAQELPVPQAMPPNLRLIQLCVQSYEYQDLKMVLTSLAKGDQTAPFHIDIAPFGSIDFSAYPHLERMVRNSEFSWLIEKGPVYQNQNLVLALQNELDRRYYHLLWEAVQRLAYSEKGPVEDLLRREIEYKNFQWALRLKIYFDVPTEEIEKQLIQEQYRGRSLAAETIRCLSLPVDQASAWATSPYYFLLNKETPDTPWKPDPRFVQRHAALELYHRAWRYFRRYPFSLSALVCFIKLKQFEEDLLISLSEGLALGFSGKDVLRELEVSP